jgi:hypothetical protein
MRLRAEKPTGSDTPHPPRAVQDRDTNDSFNMQVVLRARLIRHLSSFILGGFGIGRTASVPS